MGRGGGQDLAASPRERIERADGDVLPENDAEQIPLEGANGGYVDNGAIQDGSLGTGGQVFDAVPPEFTQQSGGEMRNAEFPEQRTRDVPLPEEGGLEFVPRLARGGNEGALQEELQREDGEVDPDPEEPPRGPQGGEDWNELMGMDVERGDNGPPEVWEPGVEGENMDGEASTAQPPQDIVLGTRNLTRNNNEARAWRGKEEMKTMFDECQQASDLEILEKALEKYSKWITDRHDKANPRRPARPNYQKPPPTRHRVQTYNPGEASRIQKKYRKNRKPAMREILGEEGPRAGFQAEEVRAHFQPNLLPVPEQALALVEERLAAAPPPPSDDLTAPVTAMCRNLMLINFLILIGVQ